MATLTNLDTNAEPPPPPPPPRAPPPAPAAADGTDATPMEIDDDDVVRGYRRMTGTFAGRERTFWVNEEYWG